MVRAWNCCCCSTEICGKKGNLGNKGNKSSANVRSKSQPQYRSQKYNQQSEVIPLHRIITVLDSWFAFTGRGKKYPFQISDGVLYQRTGEYQPNAQSNIKQRCKGFSTFTQGVLARKGLFSLLLAASDRCIISGTRSAARAATFNFNTAAGGVCWCTAAQWGV